MKTMILILGLTSVALAECRIAKVCVDGRCAYRQVCGNPMEMIAPQLQRLDPVEGGPFVPPQLPAMPPVGTGYCYPAYVNGAVRQVCQ